MEEPRPEDPEKKRRAIVNGTFGDPCPWCGQSVGEPHGEHRFV